MNFQAPAVHGAYELSVGYGNEVTRVIPVTVKRNNAHSLELLSGGKQKSFVSEPLEQAIAINVLDRFLYGVPSIDINVSVEYIRFKEKVFVDTVSSGVNGRINLILPAFNRVGEYAVLFKQTDIKEPLKASFYLDTRIPYTIKRVDGDQQSVSKKSLKARPLIVKITDEENRMASGVNVVWKVLSAPKNTTVTIDDSKPSDEFGMVQCTLQLPSKKGTVKVVAYLEHDPAVQVIFKLKIK
jgi:5-hydroxyisourate hydrolase-like protein (transthyretin family)